MNKWVRAALGAAELLVSAAVHLGYAFYIFGAAVAADVAASIVKGIMAGVAAGGVAKDVAVGSEDEAAALLDGAMPPIVLVHGIFGFGKGVHGCSVLLCSAFLSLHTLLRGLLGVAEAGRALVLRRRRGQGRPRACAGHC